MGEAEDETEAVYTLTATREAEVVAPEPTVEQPVSPDRSSDATLSTLTLSKGELSEPFDPAVTSYATDVPHEVTEVPVTATANDENAVVAFDGEDADTDTEGQQITLISGDNTVSITVTAEDGAENTYTLTVTRAPEVVVPEPIVVEAPASPEPERAQQISDTAAVTNPTNAPLVLDLTDDTNSGNKDDLLTNLTPNYSVTSGANFGGDNSQVIIYKRSVDSGNNCPSAAPAGAIRSGNLDGWTYGNFIDFDTAASTGTITADALTIASFTGTAVGSGQTAARVVCGFAAFHPTGSTNDSVATSHSNVIKVILDTTAPTAPTLSIASGGGTLRPTVSVGGLESTGDVDVQLFSDLNTGDNTQCDSSISAVATTTASETSKDVLATTDVTAGDNIYAHQIDAANNTSNCSTALANNAAPVAPIGPDLDDSTNSGVNTDNITSNTAPKLSFEAKDGATIVANFTSQPSDSTVSNSIPVSKTGTITLVETTTSGTNNDFLLTLPTLSADGDYTVSITARAAGDTTASDPSTYTFTLDRTDPTAAISTIDMSQSGGSEYNGNYYVNTGDTVTCLLYTLTLPTKA